MTDVRLPNGQMIMNVPEGTSRDEIKRRAIRAGLAPEDAFPDTFAENTLDVIGELAAAGNRTVVEIADFFGPTAFNSLLSIVGANETGGPEPLLPPDPAIDDPYERHPPLRAETFKEKLAPHGLAGKFMDPGLARDMVRGAGETLPLALGSGQLLRNAAQRLPAQFAGETAGRGVLRSMGSSTIKTDAMTGGLAGAGAELGEEYGGTPGRMVGALAAPLAPTLGKQAATAATKSALRFGANINDFRKVVAEFSRAGASPTLPQATNREFLKGFETLMSKYLGGGPINRAIDQTTKAVQARMSYIADDISLVRGEEEAGGVIRSAISGEGGFVQRFLNKSGSLWRALDDRVGSTFVSVNNTRATLDDLVTDSAFAKILNDPKIARIASAFDDAQAAHALLGPQKTGLLVDYSELKALRTIIGQKLGDNSLIADVPRAQLKRLYGAITKDIGSAAKKAGALKLFTRANNYTRSGHARINNFVERITNKPETEKIFAAVTRGGEGSAVINSFKRSMKPEEWEAVVSNVIRRLGKATPGQQDNLGGEFSLPRLLTQWNTLGPAKKALFSGSPKLNSYSRDLDTIAAVANSVKQDLNAMANASGTGQFLANLGTATAIGAGYASGNFVLPTVLLGVVGSNAAASRLITNPAFVKWLATAVKAPPQQMPALIVSLGSLAKNEEDAEVVLDLISQIQQLTQNRETRTPAQPAGQQSMPAQSFQ